MIPLEAALVNQPPGVLGESVGREGLETVVFTLAIVFSTSPSRARASSAAATPAGASKATACRQRIHNFSRGFVILFLILEQICNFGWGASEATACRQQSSSRATSQS